MKPYLGMVEDALSVKVIYLDGTCYGVTTSCCDDNLVAS